MPTVFPSPGGSTRRQEASWRRSCSTSRAIRSTVAASDASESPRSWVRIPPCNVPRWSLGE